MKQITGNQVLNRIRSENPWWQPGGAIQGQFSGLRPRPYLELFSPLVLSDSVRRAPVLMGPRRVGKTVMIHHLVQKLLDAGIDSKAICYISVDHPIYNGLGLDELISMYEKAADIDLKKNKCFIFFDEVQYLKSWEQYLKAVVDNLPLLKCVVSGSAAAALKMSSEESGAGRFTDFLLPPLTFHEYMVLMDLTDLVDVKVINDLPKYSCTNIEELNEHFIKYLNYGGYPEVALSPGIQADPGRFVKNDIVDKVLFRDLPGLYGISDIQELNHLFTTLAFNSGGEVSLQGLSSTSGVAKNTIKKYIEYLEAAFLLRVVHRIDRSGKKFKRANYFKVYLTNPSIWAALFEPLSSSSEAMGNIVETAIYSQWFHADTLLHYARWNKGEVDIVKLSHEQKAIWAVEAKWSNRYFDRPEELSSLLSFCKKIKLSEAMVTTIDQRGVKDQAGVKIDFVPASLYCYSLSCNILKLKRGEDLFLVPG